MLSAFRPRRRETVKSVVPGRGRPKGRRPGFEPLEDRALLATLFVATTGSDANPGTPAAPMHSIQHAVTKASSGDFIKVAAGSYGYDAAADNEVGYTRLLGTSTVFTVVNKQLTIIGGFTTADWGTYNPTVNPTVIDGGNQFRGILVAGGSSPTSLDLRGVTVARGLARGNALKVGVDAYNGFGGGMFVEQAPVALHEVLFTQNRALGESPNQPVGGAAGGGGLAMRSGSNATVGTLNNVSFDGNLAQAGAGTSRGGYGVGGGLVTFQYTVTGSGLSFTNNRAVGGSTIGSGSVAGQWADAQGGGLAIEVGSIANLNGVTASNNQAIGGPAPNGDAGGAYGGGVYGEEDSLTLTDSNVHDNLARGGDGINAGTAAAGFGNGGGLMTINSLTVIDRSRFVSNTALGGNGAVFKGVSGGGGVAIVYQVGKSGFNTGSINNSLVAGNLGAFGGGTDDTRGGGGGGVWIDGSTVAITQSTIADNQMLGSNPNRPTQAGQGLIVFPEGGATTVSLAYDIIADHVNNLNAGNGFAATLSVQPGATVNLNRNLFAANSNNSNAGGVPTPAGAINGYESNLYAGSAGFASPGAPQFDYRLTAGSPAVNGAGGSNDPVDITNQPRVGTPDLGAFEFHPPLREPVTNDFDGSGRSELAVFRPGNDVWIINSPNGARAVQFGDPGAGDLPAPGDYDWLGHTELAVFRPGNDVWIIGSPGGARAVQFGDPGAGDLPAPGDYDGVGHTELAVYRPGTGQWIIASPGGTRVVSFGDPAAGDVPAPGDYDGIGHAELAVFRPSTDQWIIASPNGTRVVQFGDAGARDAPAPGDYDGVGHTELAVFRPGNDVWIINSPGGARAVQFGDRGAGDVAANASVAYKRIQNRAFSVPDPSPPVAVAQPQATPLRRIASVSPPACRRRPPW